LLKAFIISGVVFVYAYRWTPYIVQKEWGGAYCQYNVL